MESVIDSLEGKHWPNFAEDILQILLRSLVRDIPDCKTTLMSRMQ